MFCDQFNGGLTLDASLSIHVRVDNRTYLLVGDPYDFAYAANAALFTLQSPLSNGVIFSPTQTKFSAALIESRKHSSRDEKFDMPSMLLVALPGPSLPAVHDDRRRTRSPNTGNISHRGGGDAHQRDEGRPGAPICSYRMSSYIGGRQTICRTSRLHDKPLTLLEIMRSRLPTAESPFLSTRHTAAMTSGSIDDEGLHLTAAVQHCGFRSVIETLWAMVDEDGAFMAKYVYRSMFVSRLNRGVLCCERSAKALQYAVRKLRRQRGITLERWVNFVHYGA